MRVTGRPREDALFNFDSGTGTGLLGDVQTQGK
jgi:hypothetical protein